MTSPVGMACLLLTGGGSMLKSIFHSFLRLKFGPADPSVKHVEAPTSAPIFLEQNLTMLFGSRGRNKGESSSILAIPYLEQILSTAADHRKRQHFPQPHRP
jgi:hypothetical protein